MGRRPKLASCAFLSICLIGGVAAIMSAVLYGLWTQQPEQSHWRAALFIFGIVTIVVGVIAYGVVIATMIVMILRRERYEQ